MNSPITPYSLTAIGTSQTLYTKEVHALVTSLQQWVDTNDTAALTAYLTHCFFTNPVEPTRIHTFCLAVDLLLESAPNFTVLDTIITTIQAHPRKRPLAFQHLVGSFQFNPVVGAVQANTACLERLIRLADTIGLDILALPEMALLGYPVKDLLIRFPHLVEQNLAAVHQLAAATHHTRVLLGFAEPRHLEANENHSTPPLVGKPYYISVAILGNRQIQGVVRKTYLPTYHEYDDARTTQPAPQVGVVRPAWVQRHYPHATDTIIEGFMTIHGFQVGITICEDIWNHAGLNQQLHTLPQHCPITAYLQNPLMDWHINLSASVSRAGKEANKRWLLQTLAQTSKRPLLYVNAAGGQDECVFDGGSRLVSPTGETLAHSLSFRQQFHIMALGVATDSSNPWHVCYPQPQAMEQPLYPAPFLTAQPSFQANQTADLARTYEALVLGIADYFKKTGFTKAVLGVSGGLDSAVTAVLLADTLGATNVVGFSFPSQLTPQENQSDTELLAKNLGIGFAACPILPITTAFLTPLETTLRQTLANTTHWGEPLAHSFAKDNVQAMSRATMLRLVGNHYNALPVATSDKSELYMGYATINGDLSGALAPLGDVCKTKLRLLATWLNTHGKTPNALPISIIERPSGADLAVNPTTGKLLTAEEALMPYTFLDEIIWRVEVLQQSFETLLLEVFEYEHQHPLTLLQKRAWLEKFYQRMQFAVFKWQVSPPILLVDGRGALAKTAYRHPILATQCQWWATLSATQQTQLAQAFETSRQDLLEYQTALVQ
jgi:NAD+ synthase (glutamine-hydrolysing)